MARTRPGRSTLIENCALVRSGFGAIENSAFMVENGRFTAVGRRADMQVPPGATRVDLSGKTVMPTMVDMHGHFGFQNVAQGTMSKEMFTRENLLDHMRHDAGYHCDQCHGRHLHRAKTHFTHDRAQHAVDVDA